MLGLTTHIKNFTPAAAEQLNGVLIAGKFMSRQQINRGNGFQCALAVDVKQAQAVDFVIEEINAVRLLAAHWEQIE